MNGWANHTPGEPFGDTRAGREREAEGRIARMLARNAERWANGDKERTMDYPYENGDVTVLGPEIFVTADKSVICWQGVNYVKQRRSWWRRIIRR